MDLRLYVIRGSHACRAGMLMLDHKGLAYRLVTLPTGLHPAVVRTLGFPAHRGELRTVDRKVTMLAMLNRLGTVPALRAGDARIQTNHAIARFLDEQAPEHPLLPADPERRRAVEEVENWADEDLQMLARRLTFASVLSDPDGVVHRGADGRMGPLLSKSSAYRRAVSQVAGRSAFAAGPAEREQLAARLPAALDRVDAGIANGVLNGGELNVADFMVAPSLALLSYVRDLAPQIESRPAGRLMDRLLPA